jgi:hypothetical protein
MPLKDYMYVNTHLCGRAVTVVYSLFFFAARKQSNHRIFVEVVSPFDNITLILLRSS